MKPNRSSFPCRVNVALAVLVAAVAFALQPMALAQQPTLSCSIEIASPKFGDPVGPDGVVKGTAVIPSNSFLWVLAHKKNINGWWPQGNGPAEVIPARKNQWEVLVTYGRERDHGTFEIAVIVVSAEKNEVLNKWFDSAQSKDYPPIRFPSTVEGCPIPKVTVMKNSE